jgi:hypothetical protein
VLEQEIADLQMPPNSHFNETELVELVKNVLAAHDIVEIVGTAYSLLPPGKTSSGRDLYVLFTDLTTAQRLSTLHNQGELRGNVRRGGAYLRLESQNVILQRTNARQQQQIQQLQQTQQQMQIQMQRDSV